MTRSEKLDRPALAQAIRDQKRRCPELLHWLYPKPSCWYCGRNGAFERAAQIAEEGGATWLPQRQGQPSRSSIG